ncbi:MAG: hypothetical protein IK038_09490 [Bacteroidaceae bacterium]|nr:hypothetical protein [Bacteroidaceae bacterium]
MTKTNIFKTLTAFFTIMIAVVNANAQLSTRPTVSSSGGFYSTDSVSSIIGTGNTAIGRNSFAGGLNSYARGAQSFAFGTNDTVTGTNAIVFGLRSKATGSYSFAQGCQNTAIGNGSVTMGIMNQAYGWAGIALGYSNGAHGLASVSIGSNTYTTRDYGITIGSGINETYPLRNSEKNILMGVNAMYPTLTITESLNDGKDYFDRTGKVAIGATVPQSKLHIHSDSGEDAGIILEADNKNNDSAFIRFQDAYRYISVGTDNKMRINAGSNNLHLLANRYCLNSESTYLENNSNLGLQIVSPQKMGLQSGNITLTGKVGINTENTTSVYALAVDGGLLSMGRFKVTSEDTIQIIAKDGIYNKPILLKGNVGINTDHVANGYALSVNGNIIAEKVMIKYHTEWPDYVFESDYKLMSMHDLRTFVTQNKHLPEVPSATEIENGLDIGQLQGVLLKKIEELTLYTLQLQEQVEQQQTEIEELKSKVK